MLKDKGIYNPFKFLVETQIPDYDYNQYFITKNYTPNNNCERIQLKHGKRKTYWKKQNIITFLQVWLKEFHLFQILQVHMVLI